MSKNGVSAEPTRLVTQTVDAIQSRYGRVVDPKIVEDVPIVLDDKERSLRMDFRAMRIIQQHTGLVMWNGASWNEDNLTPDKLATIIWACLLHADPYATSCKTFKAGGDCTNAEHEHTTIDDVESMPGMQLSNFTYITDRIGMLWGIVMPQADDSEADSEAVEAESTDPNAVSSTG